MNETIRNYWESHGLEIVAGISVLIIVILFIYNLLFKERGTYNVPNLRNIRHRNRGNINTENVGMYTNHPFPDNHWKMHYMTHNEKDSRLELQAKVILESIFKRPFFKTRPDFLRNEVTGQNLEIDLYNDELKLGVEINGDQHYKFLPFFHRNKEAFRNQRYRDEMKKVKCVKEGITLIEVPYKVGEHGLKKYLIEKLRIEGFLI